MDSVTVDLQEDFPASISIRLGSDSPILRWSPPLEDEMRHPALAQMFAHGQPRLAAAYNERVYLFD